MISALSWVHRAAAKDVPIVTEPTPEEIEEMRATAGKPTPLLQSRLAPSVGGCLPCAHQCKSRCPQLHVDCQSAEEAAEEGGEGEEEHDEEESSSNEDMDEATAAAKAKAVAEMLKSSQGEGDMPRVNSAPGLPLHAEA